MSDDTGMTATQRADPPSDSRFDGQLPVVEPPEDAGAQASVPQLAIVATEPDLITITGLTVMANHGVFDFERRDGQRFIIDVTASLDVTDAAASDDLEQTVSYADLAEEIAEAAAADPVDLLETLAERLARVVLAHRSVQLARITVHKPDAPIDLDFVDISVTVTRARS